MYFRKASIPPLLVRDKIYVCNMNVKIILLLIFEHTCSVCDCYLFIYCIVGKVELDLTKKYKLI